MGITSYTFVGATSPAPATGQKGLSGHLAALPAPDVGIEGLQADYDAIEANDGAWWLNQAVPVGELPYKQYRFYVTKAANENYWKFTITAIGYGGWGLLTHYWELLIRNVATSTWESLGSHDTWGDATLSGSKFSSLANYFSGNYVWLATQGPLTIGENPSNDFCNYIELAVKTGIGGPPGRPRVNAMKWQIGVWNPGWNG